jgi:hypothetical protein
MFTAYKNVWHMSTWIAALPAAACPADDQFHPENGPAFKLTTYRSRDPQLFVSLFLHRLSASVTLPSSPPRSMLVLGTPVRKANVCPIISQSLRATVSRKVAYFFRQKRTHLSGSARVSNQARRSFRKNAKAKPIPNINLKRKE